MFFIQEMDVMYVFAIGMAIAIAVRCVAHLRARRKQLPPLAKATELLKASLLGLFINGMLLMLCLPAPGLEFHPGLLQAQSVEQLAQYIQTTSSDMARTIDVLNWFMFMLVFWFVGTFMRFLEFYSKRGLPAEPDR